MQDTIKTRLSEIEQEHSITILYACESGSRGWGFASRDSDYDVRFIFVRPLQDYLKIKATPDTIEYPIVNNMDYNGWDLKKFLSHIYKSNGVMFEWLQSPVVYADINHFRSTYQTIMRKYFDPYSTMNHYLGLTRRTLLDFGEQPKIKIKKYFYVLRPVLAALWISEKQTIPPMEFDLLLAGVKPETEILQKIHELRTMKETTDESQPTERLYDIEQYVTTAISLCESNMPAKPAERSNPDELDQLFRETVTGQQL